MEIGDGGVFTASTTNTGFLKEHNSLLFIISLSLGLFGSLLLLDRWKWALAQATLVFCLLLCFLIPMPYRIVAIIVVTITFAVWLRISLRRKKQRIIQELQDKDPLLSEEDAFELAKKQLKNEDNPLEITKSMLSEANQLKALIGEGLKRQYFMAYRINDTFYFIKYSFWEIQQTYPPIAKQDKDLAEKKMHSRKNSFKIELNEISGITIDSVKYWHRIIIEKCVGSNIIDVENNIHDIAMIKEFFTGIDSIELIVAKNEQV